MNKILGYITTPVYYFIFGLLLGIFHILQVLAWNIFGYKAQKRTVDVLNLILLKSFWIVGSRQVFKGFGQLPHNRPLIIIANHQSMFDITPIVWSFRKHYPRFISKIELGKGIPSISYNLRKGGSALIDRSNRMQSLREISRLGREIEANNYSACIFPEGTRSRTGMLKRFKTGGVEALLANAPTALVVPFVIDGNHKLLQYGYWPLRFGVKTVYTVLEPIEPAGQAVEDIVMQAETAIRKTLGQ